MKGLLRGGATWGINRREGVFADERLCELKEYM